MSLESWYGILFSWRKAITLLRGVPAGRSRRIAAMRGLEAAIRRDLPAGTPRSRVIAFLQENKIPYHDSKDIAYFKGPRTPWGLLTRTANNRLLLVDTI